MKVLKYGYGMKRRRHYITRCSCCNSLISASPEDVEFLDDNDNATEHPTHRYRTYCPVCNCTLTAKVKTWSQILLDDDNTDVKCGTLSLIAVLLILSSMVTEAFQCTASMIIRITLNTIAIIIVLALIDINGYA